MNINSSASSRLKEIVSDLEDFCERLKNREHSDVIRASKEVRRVVEEIKKAVVFIETGGTDVSKSSLAPKKRLPKIKEIE